MDRLLEINQFTKETKLSFGDLFDLLVSLSANQVDKLPAAQRLKQLKDQIIPTRNDLEHGRAVSTRSLLISIMASDEFLETLQKP